MNNSQKTFSPGRPGMRSIWKGSVSFGLVNIPVQMYTASHEKEFSFVLLHKKDHSTIRYARICKAENKEVPWNEIVKGYEYDKGDFVVLQDEDFEKANLRKTKTIEVLHFVDENEIDSLYYSKPYFLEPDKNAGNAYTLLREALKKSHKVGLAKYVLRNREHLAVIKVYQNMLVLIQLRYQTEITLPEKLKIPSDEKAKSKEIEMAVKLIDQMTIPFKPDRYRDTYTDELMQVIKQKAKGRLVHPKTAEPPNTKVHDIMSLLKASLGTNKKPTKKSRKTA